MFRRRILGLGAATVTALVVTACGSAQTEKKGGAEGGVASQLLSSAARMAESVVSGSPLAATETKPESSAPVEEVEPRPARRPRPAPAPAVQASVETAPVAAADTTAGEPDPAATVEPDAVAEEFVEESEPVTPVAPDFTVYSSADPDVVPPIPPVASGLRPWRSGADPGPSVEVIVAGDGTVEKVQAFGRARLIDAVMLSHIKAWKFEPAFRAGEPVRYRVLLHDPVLAP